MVKTLPRKGTIVRRVYDAVAEFPGVELSAREVADECDLPLRLASAHLARLVKLGSVTKVTETTKRNLYLVEESQS